MQSVLVVGGAGYIGSHTVGQLLKKNFKIVVVDDLSTGSRSALPASVHFEKLNILNLADLRNVFENNKFEAVFHFAAKLSVPESFEKYFDYFDTNIIGTRNLLQLCTEFGVNKFIFSSTAAVYGDVKSSTVREDDPLFPQNPYGFTKKIAESLIEQQAQLNSKFKYKILRYFNVAGAEIDLTNGPRNLNSGQLILNLCKCAIVGEEVHVFGNNYPTKDGTAIRDYIHVVDLAEAHIEAYTQISNTDKSGVWNCGYGKGYTVNEVIESFEKANKVKLKVKVDPPRAGDPVQVISDNSKILNESGWRPKYNNIELICGSTYKWVINGNLQK